MKRMCSTRGCVVCNLMHLCMCVACDEFCACGVHFTRMDAQRRGGGESWALTWMWNQYVILVGVGRLRDEFCLHFSSSRPEKGPKKSPKKSRKNGGKENALWFRTTCCWDINSFTYPWTWKWISNKTNECNWVCKHGEQCRACKWTSKRTN